MYIILIEITIFICSVTAARRHINSIDDSFLNRTVTDAINRVDTAIDNTLHDLKDPHKKRTPEDLLRLFRFPSRNALQISRAAEVFERTLETLHREIEDGYAYNISHEGSRSRVIVYIIYITFLSFDESVSFMTFLALDESVSFMTFFST